MMADVACFCGSRFTFEGAAGACPRCGEVASLAGGREPAPYASDEPDTEVVDMKAGWQGGPPPAGQEFDDAIALAGLDVLASRLLS